MEAFPTCWPRRRLLAAAARMEGRPNVTHTSGRMRVVVSGDRSGSAVLGDAKGRLGTADSEGGRGGGGTDVKGTGCWEIPNCTYLRTLHCATGG